MRKLIINIIFMLVVIYSQSIMASHQDIEGWNWIENKNKVVLWQKEENEYISEILINTTVSVGGEIARGYTVKFSDDLMSEFKNDTYPVGIWKIIYKGLDEAGNLYLNIIREKDDIKNKELLKIKNGIKTISKFKGEEENLIEKRLKLFSSLLDDYIKDKEETFIIDSSRTFVIYSIYDIPPLKIELNDTHTVINVYAVELE
ncbi:MAG: hypothetical protein ACOCZT_00565 [Halanaerobiales bacterium]